MSSFYQPCDPEANEGPCAFQATIDNSKHIASGLKAIGQQKKEISVIINTGATHAVSRNKSDFVSLSINQSSDQLKGIAAGLSIWGEGIVKLSCIDDNNKIFTLQIKGYYVPKMNNVRLLPTQNLVTDKGLRGGFDAVSNRYLNGTINKSATTSLYILDSTKIQGSKRIMQKSILYTTHYNLPYMTVTVKYNDATNILVPQVGARGF